MSDLGQGGGMPQQQYQQPSGGSGKKWLIFGVVGCLGSLMLCGGIFAVFAWIGVSALTNNPEFAASKAAVESSAEIQERLGSPVTVGSASISAPPNAQPGDICLVADVSGPKGKGVMTWTGKPVGNAWETSSLVVTIGGEKIDLKKAADFDLDIDLGDN